MDVSCTTVVWCVYVGHSHLEDRCRYSNKPDLYNLCRYAHTHEELDEWKERYEWRTMKREIAKKEGVYSYMDDLLDEYQSATAGITVVTTPRSSNL